MTNHFQIVLAMYPIVRFNRAAGMYTPIPMQPDKKYLPVVCISIEKEIDESADRQTYSFGPFYNAFTLKCKQSAPFSETFEAKTIETNFMFVNYI